MNFSSKSSAFFEKSFIFSSFFLDDLMAALRRCKKKSSITNVDDNTKPARRASDMIARDVDDYGVVLEASQS